jgi:hypothetical protein
MHLADAGSDAYSDTDRDAHAVANSYTIGNADTVTDAVQQSARL